jgi:hypothetical protein
MSLDNYNLPTDPKEIARIMRTHAVRSESLYVFKRMWWMLAWYYMQGIRKFTTFDMNTGTVLGEYTDSDGKLEFQSQELLKECNRVQGRLSSLDVRPVVKRTGMSLDGIRNRSVAQIILNSGISDNQLVKLHDEFTWLLTTLGFAGLSVKAVDHPVVGLTADMEVIHPRELFPFPNLGQDYTKCRGVMRQRIVSMDFLEKFFPKKKLMANLEDMEYFTVAPGAYVTSMGVNDSMDSTTLMGAAGLSRTKVMSGDSDYGGGSSAKTDIKMVRIRELWLDGVRGTCSRYIMASGDYVFADQDHSQAEVYPSVKVARFMNNGTWYGAGMFDLLWPLARQHEKLLTSLFNNVNDMNHYGLLVIPNGQFNNRAALQEIGKDLKVLPWEPDPMTEGFRPFAISPTTTGDFPGKVAGMTKQLMQGLSPIADLIQEKGRVDSASGLSFLDEQVNQAMTAPTYGISACYSDIYRSACQQMAHQITFSRRALPVGELTTDLVGAVIDMEKNEVRFRENPIPEVGRLAFSIKEKSPRSEVARKQEAIQMADMKAKMGKPDWDSFVLFSLREGLDFAMDVTEERSAYEMIVRNILLLYGDGQSPGEIVVVPGMVRPDIQLRLLSAFMADPKMAVASVEVQNAFLDYREMLQQQMAGVLPPGVPNPEDAAMQAQMMQMGPGAGMPGAAQVQMAGPGGPPGQQPPM